MKELGKDQFEIVAPSISILAEPCVALVEENAKKHGTKEIATEYLNFLYSDIGQDIAGKWYYRPRNEKILEKYKDVFPKIELLTIQDKMFGGWDKVQEKHFDEGKIFDKLYQ